jgi:hypothetical protein
VRKNHTYPRALGIHMAAHAVMARELGLQYGTISVDLEAKTGSAEWRRTSAAVVDIDGLTYRSLVELDALMLLAGHAAEIVWFQQALVEHDDMPAARALLATVEKNTYVLDAWVVYLTWRARVILANPVVWDIVSALGDAMLRVPTWDGPKIDQLVQMDLLDRSTRFGDVPQPLPGTPPAMMRDLRDELRISPAAVESLEHVGVTTVWHLLHCNEDDLRGIKYVGRRTLQKIAAQLAERGWSIGMDIPVEEQP